MAASVIRSRRAGSGFGGTKHSVTRVVESPPKRQPYYRRAKAEFPSLPALIVNSNIAMDARARGNDWVRYKSVLELEMTLGNELFTSF